LTGSAPRPALSRISCCCPSTATNARPFSQTARQLKKKDKRDKNDSADDASPQPGKKGGKGKSKGAPAAAAAAATTTTTAAAPSASAAAAAPVDPNRPTANPEAPFDLADVAYGYDRSDRHHAEELKKLRTGGRFNADAIGAIPVQPDRKSAQTYPLRELATVAPLGGRRWSILAFDEDSIKPIMSAVQASPEFNQQPQRSDENPLELTMTVQLERADDLARRAKDVCQAWRNGIRAETHRREALHKKWRADNVILADDLRKLKEKLQKAQDDRMKVIASKEKEVLQYIMSKAA